MLADIGTGSGCLAVTLALERPGARVWATDLSADALKLARKNVVRYELGETASRCCTATCSARCRPDVRFDVIVSNPPYVTEAELPALQPEVRDYEPRWRFPARRARPGRTEPPCTAACWPKRPPYLKPGGWLLLEVGQGQAEAVAEAAARDSGV